MLATRLLLLSAKTSIGGLVTQLNDCSAQDSVVEAGGRSTHPDHCPRSEAPRESSLGVF